jgi:transcriptional regulator with XRE-family HTH domain
MSPEDIKALRRELGCTARDLGAALGVEQDAILAWERGDLFPTKRHCDAMAEIARKRRKPGAATSPMAALADAETWRLFRKLLAHPELRAAAQDLAARYPDPSDEAGG